MKTPTNLRILVIEDDLRMVELLRTGLWEHGHTIVTATTAEQGQQLADAENFDAIVLDIGLPGRSGYTIAQHLRTRPNRPAIVMLTALNQEDNIVCGLDAGADDYLTKPFSFEELLARMRALLRRSAARDGHMHRYEDMTLNPYSRILSVGAKEVELTEKEFLMMELLIKNSERPLTRREMAEYVWQNTTDSTNIVDVYINFLRKKIESLTSRKYIQTVRGIGYVLKEEDDKAV